LEIALSFAEGSALHLKRSKGQFIDFSIPKEGRIMNVIAILFLGVIVLAGSGGVLAFDINPVDVDCWGKDYLCKITKSSEGFKFPVHETLTLLAYDCYETPDVCSGGTANTSADTLKKSGRLRDLELGSEWNDDPDALLRQNITKAYQWYALFEDAKLQSECKRQPGPKCKDVTIAQNPMMLYRSHFGDMQFLHSMASAENETADSTKRKMMAWAKFTYNIFVAEKRLDTRDVSSFAEVSGIINKPGWTVGALFNPSPGGEWKLSLKGRKFGHYEPSGKLRTQNSGDEISVKHIALGSLLHMVQDSYTESHTARNPDCNPLARSKGKILTFRSYTGQQGADHAIADVYPEWLKHGKLSKGNAVWASAQIIDFAFKKEPWENVEKFLDTEVFPLSNPEAKPTAGDKECFKGM
jgi:hypothetical protein